MNFKKNFKLVLMVLITLFMIGCNKNSSDKTTNVTGEVASKETNKISTQKLTTYNATREINYVERKYVKFWDSISMNFIDTKYNSTKVEKGNIRLRTKANKQYANSWMDELDKTYEIAKTKMSDSQVELLEEQYNYFKTYYDNTEKIYTYVLDIDDEYKGKIDGNYKIRQYYALANDVRSYTILLKEYIFLLDGEVEFYTRGNDDKESKTGIKYADNSAAIHYSIITDIKFRDIVFDKYGKNVSCLLENLDYKNALYKVSYYNQYWKDEVLDNYILLKDILKGEHKDILKEQKNAYKSFLDYSTKLHSTILDKSNLYKNIYKNKGVKVENYLFKGKKMMQYNILLVEYYYAISGKIK